MTYVDLVNKVLQRLREDTVDTVDETPYSLLIGDLINETIREVEDSYDFNDLKVSIKLDTDGVSYRFSLTNANQRSKILHVYNDTQNHELSKMTPHQMTYRYMTGDVPVAPPTHYSRNGLDSNGVPMLDFYPIPQSGDEIYVTIKIPREIITVDTTEIDIPPHILILGAYSKAIQERGEDMGTNLVHAETMYQRALSDWIATDARVEGMDLDWYV